MNNYLKWLRVLTDCMSVSGFEGYDADKLISALSETFSDVSVDRLGSYTVRRNCKKADAPLLMIDAHFDQIGMIVTGHKEGGFLSVSSVGGLDTRILPACDVTVCGKKKLFGVVISTPPHLRKPDEADKLKPLSELLIDTGYTKEQVEELAPVGTPVVFRAPLRELLNSCYAGAGLDNKACAAAALAALEDMKEDEMTCNTAVLLSSFEEVGGRGALTGTFGVAPDYAVIIDVNFAAAPSVEPDDAIEMEKGPSVSLSVLTDRVLSKKTISLAQKRSLPCQTVVEINVLGTNGDDIPLCLCGIPSVNMSLPLSSMHTATEIVSAKDGETLAALLVAMVTEPGFFAKEATR